MKTEYQKYQHTQCPKCCRVHAWLRKDGLKGQRCNGMSGCDYIFTGNEKRRASRRSRLIEAVRSLDHSVSLSLDRDEIGLQYSQSDWDIFGGVCRHIKKSRYPILVRASITFENKGS